MARLYLIGTAHFDIDSSQRLEKLLAALQPVKVGIETTRKDYVQQLQASQHPNAADIAIRNWKTHFPNSNTETVELLVLNIINEVRLFSSYFNAHNLLFCDKPSIADSPKLEQASRQLLKSSPDIERLVSMPPEELRKEIATEYAQESYPVSDNPNLVLFYSMRDRFARQAIRPQLQRLAKGCILSIGGLDHLYGDYSPNLFDMLADLNPKRMKLSEA